MPSTAGSGGSGHPSGGRRGPEDRSAPGRNQFGHGGAAVRVLPQGKGRTVAVIGAGYVGLPTAATLAHLGHRVTCGEPTRPRWPCSSGARCPSSRTISRSWCARARRPAVCASWSEPRRRWRVPSSSSCACPPPRGTTGPPTSRMSRRWPRRSGRSSRPGTIVVNKSTVPVGSTLVVERVLGRRDVTVVSNPEFLREGTAVPDSLHPERIVVGADDQSAAAKVGDLFAATHAPLIVTDAATSETIKYASNAFLATKLSFVNAVAGLCEAVGADVRDVHPRARLRQAHRLRVPAPGPGLGRHLPAQGHPGPRPHRRAGRVRLLVPDGRHRHQRRAVRAGGAQGPRRRCGGSISRAPSSPCGG